MKNLVFSAIAGILCCASAASNVARAETLLPDESLDFSRSGYDYSTISPVSLAEKLNVQFAENEEEYLTAFPEYTLKYSDKIAGRYINALENDSVLTVTAENYSYIAANGSTVTWAPESVDGVPFDNGVCDFDISGLENDYITVRYGTSLTIDKDIVNGILNRYYYAVGAAADKLRFEKAAYESALEKYNSDSFLYSDYLEELDLYNQNSAAYENYLESYAEWSRLNAPYQEYLAEYAQYLSELEMYESYNSDAAQQKYQEDLQRYQEYLAECEDYEKRYDEYLQSIDTPELAQAKAQLGIIDYIFCAAGSNRTIYGAITGNTVTQVLEHKEDLKLLAGIDGKAIDRASLATATLRNLFENYTQLSGDEARYTFYINTYAALKENFNDLLRVLDYLYRNNMVKTYIHSSGREENFCILMAQLYEITDSLNSEPVENYESKYGWKDPASAVFDSSYRINGSLPSQILRDSVLDYSGDPEPLEYGYPVLPPEPVMPEKVDPPVFYEQPQKPVPPEEVASPGSAPQAVPEPVRPAEVSAPVAPVMYQPTEWETKLAEAEGKIEFREPRSTDYVLSLTTEVKKYFRNYQGVTVYFYLDREATQYEYFEESVNGSYIEYPPDLPQPQKTVHGYTCVFFGWEYYDGTPVDFNNLPSGVESVNVYPAFTQIPNLYDVIFEVDGVEYIQKAEYGSIPEFNGTPQKSAEGNRQYRFIGWDRRIMPVSDETVKYVAMFESSLIITWRVEGSADVVTSVWRNETPVYSGTPYRPAGRIYTYVFTGWNNDPVPAQNDEIYTAVFERICIVPIGDKGALITYSDGYCEADCRNSSSPTVKIDLLLDVARKNGSGIVLLCTNFTLTFSAFEVCALNDRNVCHVNFSLSPISINGYRYYISLTDDGGNEIAYSCTVNVKVIGNFLENANRVFRIDAQGDLAEVRCTYEGNCVLFTMHSGYVYENYPAYNVNVVQSEAAIFTDKTFAKRDEIVNITVGTLPEGRTLQKIYVFDSNGNEIDVSESRSFVMPAGDVTVGAVLGYRTYTVIFSSEGKTISCRTYRYGEEVVLPADPFKAPDGQWCYEFVCWEPTVSAVTSDVTYKAVFKANPLSLAVGNGGLSGGLIAIIVVCSVVVPCVIIVPIIVIIRRKRKRKAQLSADLSENC